MPRRESEAVKNLRKIPGPSVQIPPFQNTWGYKLARNQIAQFRSMRNDKHWIGLDCDVHCRSQYLFFSFHDLYEFLMEKFGRDWDKMPTRFQNQLRRQTFVKVRRTPHNTVYAFTAPKKRMDRWFKQNINRFN